MDFGCRFMFGFVCLKDFGIYGYLGYVFFCYWVSIYWFNYMCYYLMSSLFLNVGRVFMWFIWFFIIMNLNYLKEKKFVFLGTESNF